MPRLKSHEELPWVAHMIGYDGLAVGVSVLGSPVLCPYVGGTREPSDVYSGAGPRDAGAGASRSNNVQARSHPKQIEKSRLGDWACHRRPLQKALIVTGAWN